MRNKRFLFILFSFPLLAQDAAQSGDFSITGAVVSSITGERIKQAIVRLHAAEVPLHPAEGARAQTVLSDAAGAFRFARLPAGKYRIGAKKPHYSDSTRGVEVSLGPSREDLSVPLEPLGVIKGRILDSYGDPVSNVLVHALKPEIRDGRKRLVMQRWARSYTRGDYRLWDLPPGRYLVKVVGRRMGTQFHLGETRPLPSDEAFAPVFYGGGQSASNATSFTVVPGAEIPADFTLQLQPGRSIIGAVFNAVPYRTAQIALLNGEEDIAETRASYNLADGRFRVQDLVDGTYTLSISQGAGAERTRAVATVQVAGGDIQGLIMHFAPGIAVKGKVRIEGTPATGGRPPGMLRLITRGPDDLSRQDNYSALLDGTEEFTIPNVLAGRYRIDMTTGIGYVASILSGDKELLPDAELNITPDQPPAPLEIVIRTDGGRISGSVAAGLQAEAALVGLIPVSGAGRKIMTSVAIRDGIFAFWNVPPGEYRVQAWKRGAEPEYADPEVLRELAGRGELLHVEPGGQHKVELTEFTEVTP